MNFFETTSFKICIVIYFICGLTSAYLCYKKARTNKIDSLGWVIFGYVVPFIPLFFIGKSKE